MSNAAFYAARLKIERANHHMNALNGKLSEFLSEEPFETVIRFDPDCSELALCRKANKSIPAEFALIIGDTVHNLRVALDLIVFELIGTRAKIPGKFNSRSPTMRRALSLFSRKAN